MKITFLPNCNSIEVKGNKKLLDIAIENKIIIANDLCRKYMCGKCKVMITKGNNRNYTDSEKKLLTEDERKRGIRLACCVETNREDMTVILLNNVKNKLKENVTEKILKKENDKLKGQYKKEVNIAIDLGTTIIEMVVIDKNHDIVENKKFENPQRLIGADVVTRLTYGYKNDKMMTKLVRESLNKCFRKYKNIDKIIIVGNPTMIHFLMSKDISKLAVAPFKSDYVAGEIVKASSIGLDVSDKTNLVLPPLIASHVGSDAFACIYDVLVNNKENSIVLDIGTNSEILLNKRGYITTCSTAAGSAFEGMAVRCGRSYGVDVVKNIKPIYKDNKLVDLNLGVDNPSGLCASAVIDLLAILLDNNFIDNTGRLKDNVFTKRLNFTQDDVRNLQLAKAAIIAAIKLILEENLLNNKNIYDIDKVYLAGAFGKNINIDSAVKIGLFPNFLKESFVQIGNSALKGAIKLLDEDINNMLRINKDICHFELAQNDKFGEIYIENINFN